jgi:putative peptidoglycan lipid II flippase
MPDLLPSGVAREMNATSTIASRSLSRLSLGVASSAQRRILVALLTVAGGSGMVKVASVAKEVVVAGRFGTGDQIEAFVIASVLPFYVIGVVIAAFQSAVVPTYIDIRDREGAAVARQLVSTITVWTGGLLVALTLLLALLAPIVLPLIGSGFSVQKLWLTRTLFYFQLPLVILSGLTAVWGAALNAETRFALASIAPIATPALVVLLILTLGPAIGVYAIPAGMLAGAAVEGGLLLYAIARRRIWMNPRGRAAHPAVRIILKQSVTMAAGAILMGSTTVVDNAMAAMLDPGSVALLNYGSRFVLFVLAFSAGAVSTAILPEFSALVARADWPGVRRVLRSCIQWIAAITVPITAALIVFAVPMVRLMFERGAFTAEATTLVARIQILYALQVPFYLVSIVLVRLISAFRSNHLLAWGSAINVAVNVVLNYILMRPLGVSGIALSTTLVYVVSCGFLAWMALRLMNKASHPCG